MADDNERGGVAELTRALPGLLATAFVGTLNVLGLQDQQLQTVLRLQSAKVTFVALLLGLAFIAAIVSIVVHHQIRTVIFVGTLGLVILVGSLMPTFITLPGKTTIFDKVGAVLIGIVLGALVLFILTFAIRVPYLSLSGTLVVLAVTLGMVASYGAIRLQTANQTLQTAAQVGGKYRVEERGQFIDIEVAASNLGTTDRVGVTVLALPRGVPSAPVEVSALCNGKRKPSSYFVSCSSSPCSYLRPFTPTAPPDITCTVVAGSTFRPDTTGQVKQQLTFPVDRSRFQRLQVVGDVCIGTDASECELPVEPQNLRTRARLDITMPDAPPVSGVNSGGSTPQGGGGANSDVSTPGRVGAATPAGGSPLSGSQQSTDGHRCMCNCCTSPTSN